MIQVYTYDNCYCSLYVTVLYTLICNVHIKLYEQLLYSIMLHYYSATLLYNNYVSVM